MCCGFGATSVKIILEATSLDAHVSASDRRFDSPRSGKRSSHKTALGSAARMRNQVRKVVGSICKV